jgi:hypothetical protein
MLNTVLASVAALVWSIAYGWFFLTDLRRWWRARHRRRAQAAAERERARLAYAAWVRDIPPPRSRAPVMPPAPLPAALPPRRSGVIIPFPRAPAPRR